MPRPTQPEPRYGRWTVLGEAPREEADFVRKLRCRCDCGIVRDVRKFSLVSGRSTNCGCVGRQLRTAPDYVPPAART